MGSGERKQTRSPLEFSSKAEAREFVWNELVQQKVARFPFPTHGRIPNFAGAREAAKRLLAHPLFKKVRCVKVNPDTPQRYLREALLQRGVTVLVPTPRLTGRIPAIRSGQNPSGQVRGSGAVEHLCALGRRSPAQGIAIDRSHRHGFSGRDTGRSSLRQRARLWRSGVRHPARIRASPSASRDHGTSPSSRRRASLRSARFAGRTHRHGRRADRGLPAASGPERDRLGPPVPKSPRRNARASIAASLP